MTRSEQETLLLSKLAKVKTVFRNAMVGSHNNFQQIYSAMKEIDGIIQAKGGDKLKEESTNMLQACTDYIKAIDPIIYNLS